MLYFLRNNNYNKNFNYFKKIKINYKLIILIVFIAAIKFFLRNIVA